MERGQQDRQSTECVFGTCKLLSRRLVKEKTKILNQSRYSGPQF